MRDLESIMHWLEEAEDSARKAKQKEKEGAIDEARFLSMYGVLCSLIALVDLGVIGREASPGVRLPM
jgi:hypothetical protein